VFARRSSHGPADYNERLLVVRLAALGDVAITSSLTERIRIERPNTHVTFLTGKSYAPIVRLFDGVHDVLTVDERELLRGSAMRRLRALLVIWRRLLTRRFDRVLLLHVDARYRVVVAPLLTTRVDTLHRSTHGEMIPIPGRWLGDEYARLLDGAEHVGPVERCYGMADLRGHLAPSSVGDRVVALVPGGARNVLRETGLKRWPAQSYAELARRLLADGFDVVLLGSDDDRWVLPAFEDIGVRSEIGQLDLIGTLKVIRGAALVVSHDTGPMHLTRLVRTPLIALFGPTSPHELLWADDSVTVLWGGANLACRPCYDGREFARCAKNICISSIAPADVHDAARAAVARHAEQTSTVSA
jgi:heptosyltransferase-2